MKKILNAIQAVNNSDMSADIKIDVINELVSAGKGKEKAQENENEKDFVTLNDINMQLAIIVQNLGDYLFARQEGTIEKEVALNLLSDLNDLMIDIGEQLEIQELRRRKKNIVNIDVFVAT